MVRDLTGPRWTEPSYLLPDREILEAWLEFHRTTLLLKCEGLDDIDRKAGWASPSKSTPSGGQQPGSWQTHDPDFCPVALTCGAPRNLRSDLHDCHVQPLTVIG